jgi:5-methylcytosine-specific restriction endonuclease McrA
MRELVILRDKHCIFPWCACDARSCDLDHIEPYDEGPEDGRAPPGQTRPDNLAPLCRRHHRDKTFRGWTYRRLPDGSYHWKDPHGHTYLVNHNGTTNLS